MSFAMNTGTREHLLPRLYKEQGDDLHSFVVRLVAGDRQLAEDVVQETMFRAWRHADRLDHEHSLRPWLFTVARRIVWSKYRARNARPQEVADTVLQFVTEPAKVDESLTAMVVADALKSLSKPHVEVLREVYFKDRSASEAAEVLGIPIGTAKSRAHYALLALRRALEERGVTSRRD